MSSRRPQFHSEAESSDNYLGSVSDLMAALTFVFILTVAVFALRLAETQERVDRIIQTVEDSRGRLLETLQERLRDRNVTVLIDADQGVLRIREDGIFFLVGDESPAPGYEQNVGKIARVLAEVLPCYVQLNAPASRPRSERPSYCDPSPSKPETCRAEDAKVDTVLIEGHTDRTPDPRRGGNLGLASRRAQEVFERFVKCEPSLESLFNSNDLRVLGISGYGEHRPVEASARPDKNRRIDLRFMMELPDLQPGERSAAGAVVEDMEQGLQR